VVFLLLLPLIAGCFATTHVPLSERADLTKATGVTTQSGNELEFTVYGATIENDTLHAVGRDGALAIPTDSIAQISKRKFLWRNTAGLAVGVGAVAFLALFAAAMHNLATIN
jgi:hypothetical protein